MGTFAVPAQEKRKKMVKTIVTGKDNLKQAFQASKLLFHNITLLKKTNNQKKTFFFLTKSGTTQISRTISLLEVKILILSQRMLKCSIFYHIRGHISVIPLKAYFYSKISKT